MAHQRSKRLLAGVAVLALPLALAACGGDSGGGDDQATSGATTFTIWDYENDDCAMGQAWAKAIEIFETEHPASTVGYRGQDVRADPEERRRSS